jgi:hypothetical protein
MSNRVLIIAPARQGKTSLALSLLSQNEHEARRTFYYTNDANVRLRGRATMFSVNILREHVESGIIRNAHLVFDGVPGHRWEMQLSIGNVMMWSPHSFIVAVQTVKQIPRQWMHIFTSFYIGHVTDASERKALAIHFGGRIDSPPKEFTVIKRNVANHRHVAQRLPWITRPDLINYHRVIRFSPLWCRMPKDLKVYLAQFIVEWDF